MESDRTIYASRLELLDICAEQEAEIARLRKIEKAAREVDRQAHDGYGIGISAYAINELRAALAAAKEATDE